MQHAARERGFTLVELMTVVMVIAILIAIAIPTFLGARTRAQNRATQADLVTAYKAQSAFAATNDAFTADPAVLAAEESSLDWTGVDPGDVHVLVADVLPGDSRQVLLYTRSNSDTWFGLRVIRASGAGVTVGRYTCLGPAESAVDEMSDCTGQDW